MTKYVLLILAVILTLLYFIFFSKEELRVMNNKQNEEFVSEGPIVEIKTNVGTIKLQLFPEKAPITVENFLQYIKDDHYNNTLFHRVIDGFMIQGGGYTSDLNIKPTRAPIKNEAQNGLSNKIGTIAMARSQEINSATSQFYINVADNHESLDYKGSTPHQYGYCVFGKVVDGMDIVNQIKSVETHSLGPHQALPAKPIEILSVETVQ